MSNGNIELALIMRLRDLASSGVVRANRDIQASVAQTEKATGGLTRRISQQQKMREANEIIGIRSERSIQREIQRTEAAYDRLKRSGTLSMAEQARAAGAARNRIRELNNEMGKFTLAQKIQSRVQAGAVVAGGVAAGGYVLSKPVGQTMDYGVQLANMANTAFTERGTLGRIAGKRELNAAIEGAVRFGGGAREGAADTLNTLIASGAMSPKEAMGMLPTLMKSGTASGADPSQLAQIGIRGMQTFGIKPNEMPKVIDMSITAGQAGGFELKDMAKWLPQQMAAAKLSGLSGIPGMAKLLAANQAAAITAGTKDEAGNNLVNLLAKINSNDTAKDAQRLGINLSGTLAAARGKGMDSLDAFVGIVDHITKGNKEYQAIQNKLKTATGKDRNDLLESQGNILQGSAIGQIVQDRQALMALVGIMGNREYMADVQKKVLDGEGATEKNFSVISQEPGFKVQQAANEKVFATQSAFEKLTPLIGKVADGMTENARQYPLLTASAVAATTALAALAAAAFGMAGLSTLMGGKGAAGGLTETVLNKTKGGIGALGRGVAAAGSALVGTTAVGAMAAGSLGYGAGTLAYEHGVKGSEFGNNLGGTIASILAAFGNKEAERAIEVNLHLDGEQIATVVNKRNTRTAARH